MYSLMILVTVILTGTFGFYLLEDSVHSLFEAFYFTLSTVTTVGYGDFVPTNDVSRALASLVMLAGIGATLSVLQSFFDMAVSQSLREELGLPEKRTKLKDHYIICGFGLVGKQVMQQLKAKGEKFVVIERSRSKVEDMVEMDIPVIEGEAQHEDVLERANIAEAKGLLAVMPESTNIIVAITAKMLNPNIHVVAEIEDLRDGPKLKRAGADEVVHVHEMGAKVMVSKARKVILDPVCGEEVDPETAQFIQEYEGEKFYFCSQECMDTFKRSPRRYMEMRRMMEMGGGRP
jgi:voltage-gated potassium channel